MKKTFFIGFIILALAVVFTNCSGNNKPETGQLTKNEIYTCSMHNEAMSDHPGECPKCGMTLRKQKMTAEQEKMRNEGAYIKPKE